MATGVQNIPVKSGVIYIKPHGGVTFPDGDGINNNDHFLAMEGATGFTDIGDFQNFSLTRARTNERTVNSDKCEGEEVISQALPIWTTAFDYLASTNLDILGSLVGVAIQSVAGTPVTGATKDITGATAGKFVTLGVPTGSSAVSITSITGSTDGALAAGTDYDLVQDGSGFWGVVLKAGGAITTFAQTFSVVFAYTPVQYKILSERSTSKSDAYVDIKFVTCPNSNNERDTVYLVKGKITSDYVINWVNLANSDVSPSSTSISTVQGGNAIYGKSTLTEI